MITAKIGSKTSIPCNVTIPENDNALLILWYKEDINGSPIYSVDGRNKHDLSSSQHFKSHLVNNRVHFYLNSNPYSLIIDPVEEQDDGLYFCRVDFKWSRTLNFSIRLNVTGTACLSNQSTLA